MQRITTPLLSLAFVLGLVFLATTVKAEPVERKIPPPTTLNITRGIICDTAEQVETTLTRISLGGTQRMVEGCGFVRGMLPANITPLYWYETDKFVALIARFDAVLRPYTQFGWVAYEAIVEAEPPDEPL